MLKVLKTKGMVENLFVENTGIQVSKIEKNGAALMTLKEITSQGVKYKSLPCKHNGRGGKTWVAGCIATWKVIARTTEKPA